MKQDFQVTIEDVKDFLESFLFFWNGKITDSSGEIRKAKVEDFKNAQKQFILLQSFDQGFFKRYLNFNSFEINIYDAELGQTSSRPDIMFSTEWQEYLLEQYKEKYADILNDWCERKIKALSTVENAKNNNLLKKVFKIKSKVAKKIGELKKLQHLAQQYLTENIQIEK